MEFLVGAKQKVMISLFIVFRFYSLAPWRPACPVGRGVGLASPKRLREGKDGHIYKSIHFFEFYKSLVLSGL